MLGTDLYKVTQEVTDAVDVMVATKSLGGGTIEEVLGGEMGCWGRCGEGGRGVFASHAAHECMTAPVLLFVSFPPAESPCGHQHHQVEALCRALRHVNKEKKKKKPKHFSA